MNQAGRLQKAQLEKKPKIKVYIDFERLPFDFCNNKCGFVALYFK